MKFQMVENDCGKRRVRWSRVALFWACSLALTVALGMFLAWFVEWNIIAHVAIVVLFGIAAMIRLLTMPVEKLPASDSN